MKNDTIRVMICYSERGAYGPIQHTMNDQPTLYTMKGLQKLAQNADSINWDGVRSVAYDTDLRVVFQVRGYTYNRGMFCDLPDINPYYRADQPYPYHTQDELREFLDSVPTYAMEIMEAYRQHAAT